MRFYQFLLSRLLVFVCVIFVGVTVVFFVPRLLPSDPVDAMLASILSQSNFISPEAIEAMRETLNVAYGLDGTLWEQYTGFLWRAIFTQDFGPSFSQYPTNVSVLIGRALPWTMGLLLSTTVISWVLGNFIGLLAGFRKGKWYAHIMEYIAIFLYPIPYYIFALVLIILFAYVLPIFPLAVTIRTSGFTWEHIANILYNSALPALSMILVGTGWWVISMMTLASNTAEEDYVGFARLKGLSERRIMYRYVRPNAALPQVTMLALRLGGVFGGAMITEMLFTYPGIGMLIYTGIVQNDYNLIMGSVTISIVAVATATFIVDILYPFMDPRVRLR